MHANIPEVLNTFLKYNYNMCINCNYVYAFNFWSKVKHLNLITINMKFYCFSN